MYSPLNQGCSSLIRSVLTMRERWMRTKRRGVEPRLHAVHRLAEEMRLVAEVQPHVVAGRLDPVDLVGPQEEHAAARLHDQALDAAAARGLMSWTSASRRRPRSPARRRSSAARAWLQRLLKPILAERLQQVVERVHLERLQRVLVVGGDEDHRRHPVGADAADHLEAVAARASARRGTRGRARAAGSPTPPARRRRTRRRPRRPLPAAAATARARARAARRRRPGSGSWSRDALHRPYRARDRGSERRTG